MNVKCVTPTRKTAFSIILYIM